MAGRSRQDRRGKGPQRRSLTMGEFQTALANLKPEQRSMLFRMFPEPKEPAKLPEKITRRQLLAMWEALEATLDLPSRMPDFAYAIVQNRAKMRDEIRKLEKAMEPSDAYKAFDVEREALCTEFARTDAEGKATHDGTRYAIPPEKREEFDKRAGEIKEKHAVAIDDYKAQASKYDRLLDAEIACPKFVLIPPRALPAGLTARQLEPLQIMLE